MPHPDYLLVPVPAAAYDRLLAHTEESETLAMERHFAATKWRDNLARAEDEAVRAAVGMVVFNTFFTALGPAFTSLRVRPAPYPPEVWPPGRPRIMAFGLPSGWVGVEVSFQVEHEAEAARRRLGVPAKEYNPFRCAVARDVLVARWGATR